ncbi:GNAT family N-acetyltransferase [Chitinimonas naiadis]
MVPAGFVQTTATVMLKPYQAQDEPVLRRLAELYAYDFSELTAKRIGTDGCFLSDAQFHEYFPVKDCHTFFILAAGELAGFAMVAERSMLTGTPGIHDMVQFMVLRAHRQRGLGALAATALFERFTGPWEVRQMAENPAAQRFWRRVITAYTAGRFTEGWARHPEGDELVQYFDTRPA